MSIQTRPIIVGLHIYDILYVITCCNICDGQVRVSGSRASLISATALGVWRACWNAAKTVEPKGPRMLIPGIGRWLICYPPPEPMRHTRNIGIYIYVCVLCTLHSSSVSRQRREYLRALLQEREYEHANACANYWRESFAWNVGRSWTWTWLEIRAFNDCVVDGATTLAGGDGERERALWKGPFVIRLDCGMIRYGAFSSAFLFYLHIYRFSLNLKIANQCNQLV